MNTNWGAYIVLAPAIVQSLVSKYVNTNTTGKDDSRIYTIFTSSVYRKLSVLTRRCVGGRNGYINSPVHCMELVYVVFYQVG